MYWNDISAQESYSLKQSERWTEGNAIYMSQGTKFWIPQKRTLKRFIPVLSLIIYSTFWNILCYARSLHMPSLLISLILSILFFPFLLLEFALVKYNKVFTKEIYAYLKLPSLLNTIHNSCLWQDWFCHTLSRRKSQSYKY